MAGALVPGQVNHEGGDKEEDIRAGNTGQAPQQADSYPVAATPGFEGQELNAKQQQVEEGLQGDREQFPFEIDEDTVGCGES